MRIIVADDHALFRDGLKSFLEELDSDVTLFQASNYKETLKTIYNEKNIDLVILDLSMPDMNWEKGLKEVMKHINAKTKVLIVSAIEDIKTVTFCLEQGVRGYTSKRSDPKVLGDVIKLILDGEMYVPSVILEQYVKSPSKVSKNNKIKSKDGLTERQAQVLKLAASGLSNKQIAYELNVTESTIKLHINSLLRSLGATNRTQAVINAQKKGLI